MPVNLFDPNFYRAANLDLAGLDDTQAFSHFLTSGLNEGRKFSPFADLNFYRSSNPDLTSFSSQQAYEHLQNFGVAEGRRFSQFIDLNYYRASNPDLAGFNNEQAFGHLQSYGIAEGRLFSVPFDINYYRSVNSDLAAAGLSNQQLYEHFQLNGLGEGRASSPLFNISYYLANNSDLRVAGFNNEQAYDHFVLFGLPEGRSGSAFTGDDYAGNALGTARNIAIEGISTTFRDFLGNTDTNDFYRFNLNNTSDVSLSLNGLKGDAKLEILDSNGEVIQSSANGTTPESISQILDPGDYYIRVYQNDLGSNTDYNLNVTVTPRTASSFDIQFDYRFDTNGFFNDPNRRAALEAAAKIWESTIKDEFTDVPVGTATPYLTNPQTGDYAGTNNIFITDAPIDDIVVFVGARELGGDTLAESVPSGWYNNETRYTSSNFEPWAGSITFDSLTQWFFDPTPNTSDDIPATSDDFLSTAVHELGHVLGIGTSDAFDNYISDSLFNGPNAKAVNGNNPIPLDSGLGHVQEGFTFGGVGSEALMDPYNQLGVRKLPTPLDIALLVDIGYQV